MIASQEHLAGWTVFGRSNGHDTAVGVDHPFGKKRPFNMDQLHPPGMGKTAGCIHQIHAVAATVRCEDSHTLLGKKGENHTNSRYEVRVSRNDQGSVEPIQLGVSQEVERNVDIGFFLLMIGPGASARVAGSIFLLEDTHDRLHAIRLQRGDERAVSGKGTRSPGCIGGEVINVAEDLMGRWCELETKTPEIQPLQMVAAGIVQSMVQIESVNEGRNAHGPALKRESPWTVAHGHHQDVPGGMNPLQYNKVSRTGKPRGLP